MSVRILRASHPDFPISQQSFDVWLIVEEFASSHRCARPHWTLCFAQFLHSCLWTTSRSSLSLETMASRAMKVLTSGCQESVYVYCKAKRLPPDTEPEKTKSRSVRVQFRVRFHALKVPIVGGVPLGNPTHKAIAKALLRGISLSEYGSEGFQVD